MDINPTKKTCDTMGCHALATHVLTTPSLDFDDSPVTYTDQVCEPCGQGYLRRPVLRATLAPMDVPTNASGFTQGDHVTLTRTPAGVGNPATLTVSGKLTSLVIKDGRLSGGTIQAPNGPVILDLDADRMMRLYGVTQTLRKDQ